MMAVAAPPDRDPHSLAEFVEATLILGEDDFFSAVEILGCFPTGDQPTEAQIDDSLAEIERRSRDFGALYPFRVEQRGVAFDRGGSSDLYATLVLLSLKGMPLRQDGDYQRSDPIFDDIAERAFLAHMGEGAKSVQFGWPPRGGRPTGFPEAVAWLAGRLGVEVRDRKIPTHYKDDGVDVFAWKPYPDGRPGFPLLAAQNTVQFAFSKKPRDVVPSHWREWLYIGVDPTVGFAIPFVMPDEDPWHHTVQTNVYVMLDRGRIIYELRHEDPITWSSWQQIVEFAAAERQGAGQEDDATASIVTRRKPGR